MVSAKKLTVGVLFTVRDLIEVLGLPPRKAYRLVKKWEKWSLIKCTARLGKIKLYRVNKKSLNIYL